VEWKKEIVIPIRRSQRQCCKHEQTVDAAFVTCNGEEGLVTVSDADHKQSWLMLWHLNSGSHAPVTVFKDDRSPRRIVGTKEGTELVVYTQEGAIKIYDTGAFKMTKSFTADFMRQNDMDFAVSRQGTVFAFCGNSELYIVGREGLEKVRKVSRESWPERLQGLQFSPSGQTLVGYTGEFLSLFDVQSGEKRDFTLSADGFIMRPNTKKSLETSQAEDDGSPSYTIQSVAFVSGSLLLVNYVFEDGVLVYMASSIYSIGDNYPLSLSMVTYPDGGESRRVIDSSHRYDVLLKERSIAECVAGDVLISTHDERDGQDKLITRIPMGMKKGEECFSMAFSPQKNRLLVGAWSVISPLHPYIKTATSALVLGESYAVEETVKF
jgi:hypothetical protein